MVIFSSFYFLNALQSDINSNRVYVLRHKYIYAHKHKLYCYSTTMLIIKLDSTQWLKFKMLQIND